MNEDKKKRYFYMAVGHIGLFLLGVFVLRHMMVFDDSFGTALGLFGFLMTMSYVRFAEKKFGITEKESRISRTALTITLLIVALFFYPPWVV